MRETSPSGKTVVQSVGPMDAEMIWVGDSPSYKDQASGEMLTGRAKGVAASTTRSAGVDLTRVRFLNLVPVRPVGDEFNAHSAADLNWGVERARKELAALKNAKVIYLMGENAMRYLGGFPGAESIDKWRGSAFQVKETQFRKERTHEEYLSIAGITPDRVFKPEQWIIPSYHPKQVASQYPWHPWLIMDLERGQGIIDGKEQYLERAKRRWFFNDLTEFERLADLLADGSRIREHSGIVGFDTESWPYYIVGVVTDEEVHVFAWDEKFRAATQKLFASPYVVKVAHNIQHDLSFLKKKLAIDVALPWFDTMGGANVLNNAMQKALSPHISTRYTNWAYHKWLVDIDPLWYNGMDNVVAFDAYLPQIEQLFKRNLYEVAKHDHQLLEPLLDMQWFGFKVDHEEQQKALVELTADSAAVAERIKELALPIVDARIAKFKKPHLFEHEVRCSHCGGGKTQAAHCWRCGGLEHEPVGKAGFESIVLEPEQKRTIKNLKSALPQCAVCNGTGKVTKRLEINPESAAQVGDLLYRGLGIPPRRYKGAETVRVGQIEPLAEKYPLAKALVEFARVNADKETVERLSAGPDGRLHCVFDPFGTSSGRVASKEGLVEVGTNAMNIPKKSRILVVPDREMIFLYPDMKAVEGRAIAVLSKDKKLIEVFNDPKADMHVIVRDAVRKLGFVAFSRDQAKRLEYATFYGGSPAQIAVELNNEALQKGEGVSTLTEAQVKLMQDVLLTGLFIGIANWHAEIKRELLATRRITSPTGRQRIWTDYIYDPKTKSVKNEIVKQGYSFGPQDIGAWVLGDGMLRAFKGDWERFRGLIHVHDALLFQAKIEDEEEAKAVLSAQLSSELWGMKFLTEMKTGKNWKEAS